MLAHDLARQLLEDFSPTDQVRVWDEIDTRAIDSVGQSTMEADDGAECPQGTAVIYPTKLTVNRTVARLKDGNTFS